MPADSEMFTNRFGIARTRLPVAEWRKERFDLTTPIATLRTRNKEPKALSTLGQSSIDLGVGPTGAFADLSV